MNLSFKAVFLLAFHCRPFAIAQTRPIPQNCEHVNIDIDWRFAYGNPVDATNYFNKGTSYFSYLAKAGYGNGVAAPRFDDRP